VKTAKAAMITLLVLGIFLLMAFCESRAPARVL
jgi:hypothetical protein